MHVTRLLIILIIPVCYGRRRREPPKLLDSVGAGGPHTGRIAAEGDGKLPGAIRHQPFPRTSGAEGIGRLGEKAVIFYFLVT